MGESQLAMFKELQALVQQAIGTLGECRTALVAGCSISAVQAWQRRSALACYSRTVQRALPRLRMWETWAPGYVTARREIERMQAEPHTVEGLLGELRTSLAEVSPWYALAEIANGCEVRKTQLEALRAGYVPEGHVRELITSVAHLRFWRLWPASVALEAPEGVQAAESTTVGALGNGRAFLPVAASRQ